MKKKRIILWSWKFSQAINFHIVRKFLEFMKLLAENEDEGWPPSQNSAQYERVVELLADFRSCLMIDFGRETDGNNKICLGVRFALCMKTIRFNRFFASYCPGLRCTVKCSQLRKLVAYEMPKSSLPEIY